MAYDYSITFTHSAEDWHALAKLLGTMKRLKVDGDIDIVMMNANGNLEPNEFTWFFSDEYN